MSYLGKYLYLYRVHIYQLAWKLVTSFAKQRAARQVVTQVRLELPHGACLCKHVQYNTYLLPCLFSEWAVQLIYYLLLHDNPPPPSLLYFPIIPSPVLSETSFALI